jgi:hypothetical protein
MPASKSDPCLQFGSQRVRCEEHRKTLGIATRHTAFSGHAVNPNMAPGGCKPSGVALHVVAVDEAEVKLGFGAQLQPIERCKKSIVDAWLSTPIRKYGDAFSGRC